MTARQSLRVCVTASGLSLRAFAKAHGFSAPLISMWISGERTPGLPNAFRLQKVTGIPAEHWRRSRRRAPRSMSVAQP